MPEAVMWAFIGILLTALLGSILTRQHKARDRFNAAAETFRSAFLPSITRLNTEPGSHRNILAEEFGRHQKAAIAFRQHLGRRIKRFDKAWQAYEAHAKEQTDVPILAFLGTEVLDMAKAKDPAHIRDVADVRKKECLDHINSLLKFAEPK